MAENPGSGTGLSMADMRRAELMHRLRAHAEIEDVRHASDLRSAVNEIEQLSMKLKTIELENLSKAVASEPFRNAWGNLAGHLVRLVEMMDDPYKAPEQSVELIPDLMTALWEFQIEWVVLNRVR